jgi:uncharacterized membrane protein
MEDERSCVGAVSRLLHKQQSRMSHSSLLAVVLLMLFLITSFTALQAPLAVADESPSASTSTTSSATPSASASQSASTGGMTVTDSITDTQNLLGSQASLVNDTIVKTKSETGVTVRLLYLSTFSGNSNPEKWTSAVLESTDPPANTVLLAVASQDGNLVVAVSGNSDDWLKQQSTVDELSDAAWKPITEGDTPDWAKSAINMMSSITQIEQTSTTTTTQHVGISVFIAVLVLLLIAAVVMFVFHQRKKKLGNNTSRADRHTRHQRERHEAATSQDQEHSSDEQSSRRQSSRRSMATKRTRKGHNNRRATRRSDHESLADDASSQQHQASTHPDSDSSSEDHQEQSETTSRAKTRKTHR